MADQYLDIPNVQMGFWLPNRVWATKHFMFPLREQILKRQKENTLTPMSPAITEFKAWVNANSVYRMWVHLMIEQANYFIIQQNLKTVLEITKDGDWFCIPGFDFFFLMLNEIVTTSPSFNETCMVGTPMNGLLAVSMATEAGLALFHDETFNTEFKKVLDSWNAFLKSGDSLDKLDIEHKEKPGSWISQEAIDAGVWDDMVKDENAPGYGYDSWNSFFIREFLPGARPFLGTDDDINIGCETTPWEYVNDLKLSSQFWIKEVNYSLMDLFAGNEYASAFEGGQLYQGFLSATHYHRWNCPLKGNLIRSWVQPGTYFAQRALQGEVPGTWEGTDSQPYLGHVAARAIFIFEHDKCGLVALFCIGMVEVSTCYIIPELLVGENDPPIPLEKGMPLGNFEFGGSTHCMLFQKDKVVLADWAQNAVEHQNDENPIHMGTVIASPINTCN